ncbi:MAG: aminopeptidase P family protein [Actinomycetota bacterium]|nr:aminopeptidase P family protein [Actinomycetota bacterium]
MNSDHRLSALRRRLVEEGIPAVVITDISNVVYLTGFDDVFDAMANAALLVTTEIARIYTDSRYSSAASAAAESTSWAIRVPADAMYVELCSDVASEGIEVLILESSVPYGRFRFISEKFGGNVRVVDQLVEGLRQVKEAREIARIKDAAAVTDLAFDHILGFIAPGKSEREIGLELEVFMRTNGGSGIAFDPIVASGPNSAKPHAGVTDRQIEMGDFVKLDFGARVAGYCSDMTRTLVVGTASDHQREIHSAVLRANLAGIDACRAGRSGADIHAAAKAVLDKAGFGDRFGHGLGHGVGLDIHERPSLSPRGRDPVLSGSVVTIEPGVYIPEYGGVRIEDLVVVEDGGCTLLSHSPKELIEL